MFKTLLVYQLTAPCFGDLEATIESASNAAFVPCMPSQEMSVGFVSPRATKHSTLVEAIGGHWLLRVLIERKTVPGALLRKHLHQRIAALEESSGRTVGSRERKDLKFEVHHDLLIKAFPKEESVLVWLDKANQRIALDAGSKGKIDAVLTLLGRTFDGFCAVPLPTGTSPTTGMAQWLTSEPPMPFTIDDELELRAPDVRQSTVKYTRHNLDIDEVRAHLSEGKTPVRLAMTWADKVSFVLTDTLQLKKVTFVDGVLGTVTGEDDPFDSLAAITTTEFARLIPDLMDVLAGPAEAVPA
jgi:recombination associated protein RdgC